MEIPIKSIAPSPFDYIDSEVPAELRPDELSPVYREQVAVSDVKIDLIPEQHQGSKSLIKQEKGSIQQAEG